MIASSVGFFVPSSLYMLNLALLMLSLLACLTGNFFLGSPVPVLAEA